MRVGVVSDTHGHAKFTQQAVDMLRSLDVEVVLHCGDIGGNFGTAKIVRLFDDWPTHFIFGNNDHSYEEIRTACAASGHTCHDFFGEIELAGSRMALTHGHIARDLSQAIASGVYDVICCGHTHVARNETIDNTHILNPGALYRANPKSFAVLELPERTVQFFELDC